MSGFSHDIAGGQGNLIITSLQSPNFETGVQGWQIAKDGDAEFNDVVIRGSFEGTDFIIAVQGFFLYDGTPGAGNPPIISISNTDSDPYGNTVIAGGVNVYNNTAGSWVQLGSAALNFWTGDSAQTELGFIEMETEGSGTTRQLAMLFQSPQINSTETSSLFVQSGSDDGTIGSQIIGQAGSSAEFILGNDANGKPQFFINQKGVINGYIYVQNAQASQVRLRGIATDTTSTTVTATSFTQFTKSWAIPANDPAAGTGYRLKCWGNGTWGSTQRQLTMRGNFTGAGGLGAIPVASTFINASESFAWVFETDIILTGTGSSAGYVSNSRLNINQNANPSQPGTTADNAMGLANIGGSSSGINTTAAMTMWVEAEWNGASASITCTGSTFEPIGA